MCSYVEKCAEFKNKSLKTIGWYTKVLYATEYTRVGNIPNSAEMGVSLHRFIIEIM